jgi:hypothetical protein
MDDYLRSYKSYSKKVIYQFKLGYGGIGDCIKYFMCLLHWCIQKRCRLYYQIMYLPLENYLRLVYQDMYIHEKDVGGAEPFHMDTLGVADKMVCTPFDLYDVYQEFEYPIHKVFTFSQAIWYRKKEIFPLQEKYVSVHIRLGDKHLETDPQFVIVKEDERPFQEEALFRWIREHRDHTLVVFCDNTTFKQYIHEVFPHVHITSAHVGHTSLLNTTDQHVIDAVTEFYILTKSESIVANCVSGFSDMAAKFNRIPISYFE